jgi:hypothetical protein
MQLNYNDPIKPKIGWRGKRRLKIAGAAAGSVLFVSSVVSVSFFFLNGHYRAFIPKRPSKIYAEATASTIFETTSLMDQISEQAKNRDTSGIWVADDNTVSEVPSYTEPETIPNSENEFTTEYIPDTVQNADHTEETEAKTADTVKDTVKTPVVGYQNTINTFASKNFIACTASNTGNTYAVHIGDIAFTIAGHDNGWSMTIAALNRATSETYIYSATNKNAKAATSTASAISTMQVIFPDLYDAEAIESGDYVWTVKKSGNPAYTVTADGYGWITNIQQNDAQTVFLTQDQIKNGQDDTAVNVKKYFIAYAPSVINMMENEMRKAVNTNDTVGIDHLEATLKAVKTAEALITGQPTPDDLQKQQDAFTAETESFIKALDLTADDWNAILAELPNYGINDYTITGFEKDPNKDALDIHYFSVNANGKTQYVLFSESTKHITAVKDSLLK